MRQGTNPGFKGEKDVSKSKSKASETKRRGTAQPEPTPAQPAPTPAPSRPRRTGNAVLTLVIVALIFLAGLYGPTIVRGMSSRLSELRTAVTKQVASGVYEVVSWAERKTNKSADLEPRTMLEIPIEQLVEPAVPAEGNTAGINVEGSADQVSDNATIYVNGVAVGVLNPQVQIGHPAFYLETGVTGSIGWTIQAPGNAFVIAGGYTVNDKTNGVYQAWKGGDKIRVDVTDGFVLVTTSDWARDEFCFRLGQAVDFGWAHSNELPLTGWAACPTTSVAAPPANAPAAGERVPSGQNKTAAFVTGDEVYGWEIVLTDGRKCTGGECYLPSAPVGGTVLSGVVNPWDDEVPASTLAKPWVP